MDCKVCQSHLEKSHTTVVLGKYEATYNFCPSCGFLSVHEPHWLDEAYSDAIAALDTGVLGRNLAVAKQLVVILDRVAPEGPYLDIGGGHGLLVRRMRDLGFAFRWSDRHASNHYARGFEDDRRTYEAVTAVEVLEHLEDPLESVREWINRTSAEVLIFTQVTFTGPPPPKDWWYYAPTSGQHISFYQPRTLETIAAQLSMYYAAFGGLHLFTRRPLPVRAWDGILTHPRAVPFHAAWLGRKRKSLTQSDSELIASAVAPGGMR